MRNDIHALKGDRAVSRSRPSRHPAMTGSYYEGRPYVVAGIMLPRLNLAGEVRFMMDTSSDLSLLSPSDALRLGCPQDGASISKVIGWEGRMEVRLEQALMAFDDISFKFYGINLGVVATEPVPCSRMPSILGRDLMSRWRIVMEPREEVLEIALKDVDLDDAKTNLIAHAIRLHEQRKNRPGRL